MLTYRIKRDKLQLPDASAPVHPDTYVRLIHHENDVALENASLEEIPMEKDSVGKSVRRTMVLKDIRPDPRDPSYVFCDVDELVVRVKSQP